MHPAPLAQPSAPRVPKPKAIRFPYRIRPLEERLIQAVIQSQLRQRRKARVSRKSPNKSLNLMQTNKEAPALSRAGAWVLCSCLGVLEGRSPSTCVTPIVPSRFAKSPVNGLGENGSVFQGRRGSPSGRCQLTPASLAKSTESCPGVCPRIRNVIRRYLIY